MSSRNLRSLAKFLATLGLETDKIPSVSDFRKAYRGFMHLHPDKAGDDSLARFQEITEAAKEVFEFLTTTGNLKHDEISDDDILGSLVKDNNLQFNKKCVTLDLSTDTVDDWLREFKIILGPSKPLNNSETGIQFKKESWCLDSDSSSSLASFGSVSVNFHPTTRKIVVQGSAYLDFTTFAIPAIVEKMKTPKHPITTAAAIDTSKKTLDVPTTENAASDMTARDENNTIALIEGFRRMEGAVVELRTDLLRKIDDSVVNATGRKDDKMLDEINKKLERLDSLLVENKTEMASINEKLAVLADKSMVKLEPSAVQEIVSAVSIISDTKGVDLEKIATAVNDVKVKLDVKNFDDIAHTNKKVLEKLESVEKLSDTFTSGLEKLENIFEKEILREVVINSEKSVSALNTLNSNMEKFLSKCDVKNSVEANTKEPVKQIVDNVENISDKTKIRKAKLFSSSVALGCDKKRLEFELDCDLEIVDTYHISENSTAPDPDKYLDNMIKTHLKPGEVDFIIISVGSNDITFLSSDEDEVTLNKEAIEQSSVLAEIAYQAGEKFGIDVFVTVRPARYDKKVKDTKGLKSKLNQSANGMQVALISVLEKVHNVHLPALENLTERDKKELFKNDGIHLTKAGLCALEDNLIEGIKSVYSDIKDKDHIEGSRTQQEHGLGGRKYGRQEAGRQEPGRHGDVKQDHGRPGPGSRGGYRPGDRGRHAGGGDDRRPYYTDQHRQQNKNWRGHSNRQMHDMQNMVRDFMMFMDNGSDRFRGRYRY